MDIVYELNYIEESRRTLFRINEIETKEYLLRNAFLSSYEKIYMPNIISYWKISSYKAKKLFLVLLCLKKVV